jgi:hypothetical protein
MIGGQVAGMQFSWVVISVLGVSGSTPLSHALIGKRIRGLLPELGFFLKREHIVYGGTT